MKLPKGGFTRVKNYTHKYRKFNMKMKLGLFIKVSIIFTSLIKQPPHSINFNFLLKMLHKFAIVK